MVSNRFKVLTVNILVRFIMPKRKRSSDYCNADAKRKKERIAAETSNERRATLSAVRLRCRIVNRVHCIQQRFRTIVITTT